MPLLILLTVLLLAYTNGANDNFKGVATLFGSGTTNYHKALAWATVTTAAGSLLALLLAGNLINTFKGKGLVPDVITAEPMFLLSVSLGATLTVLLATRFGLPVSTTHALTGGLVGAGLLATGGHITWAALTSSFLLPLLGSPLLAMVLTLVVYPLLRMLRGRFKITRQSCVCIGDVYEVVSPQPNGTFILQRQGMAIQTGQLTECIQRYDGRMFGMDAGNVLDKIHYVSAGAVGFSRGLNDTPKIVALMLAVQAVAPNLGLAMVTAVMALGGILNARRVAETMSRKITRMNAGQGFTANLITSLLVTFASRLGLPVSTTHVSVGALFAIGAVNGTARKDVIATILTAWVTTLPLAAVLSSIVYWSLRHFAQ